MILKVDPLQSSMILYLRLTPREREVSGLVADGLDNNAIASVLCIQRGVVANMLARVYDKFGFSSKGLNVRVLLANTINEVRRNALG